MKKIIVFVLLGALVAFSGCTNREGEIYGSWECLHEDDEHCDWLCSISFTEAGSFTDGTGVTGQFTVDGDMLTLTQGGSSETFEKRFSAGRLVLRMPDVPGLSGQIVLRRSN